MAEQDTPAPAPVETPAPAPLEVKMATPDMHVELRTARGEPRVVPIATIVKDAQIYESGLQLQAEAKEKLRDMHVDIAHAQRYREEQDLIARNPDEYVATAMRRATLAKGAPLAIQQQNTNSEEDAGVAPRNTSASDERIRRLEENQHQFLVGQQQAQVKTDVQGALAEFPLLSGADPNNAALRTQAEKVLLAAKMIQPEADLRRVASDFYSGLVTAGVVQRTAVRDTRAERAATMPAISPQAGSPDARALEAQSAPKAADLRTDAWKEKGRALIAKLQGGAGL